MDIICKGLIWCNNPTGNTSTYIEYKIVGFTKDDKLLLYKLDGTTVESWLPKKDTLSWIITHGWLIKFHPNIPKGDNILNMLNSPDIETKKLAIAIIENYKET